MIREWTGLTHDLVCALESTVLAAVRRAGFAALTREDVPYGEGFTECFPQEALDLATRIIEAADSGTEIQWNGRWLVTDTPMNIKTPSLTLTEK